MNIYCVGHNYIDHIKELKNEIPKKPIFFQKNSTCISKKKNILLNKNDEIHYELELVLTFKNKLHFCNEEEVYDFISDYSLGLDLTNRKLQIKSRESGLPWFESKCFPNSAVLTKSKKFNYDEINNDFWLKINNTEVQRGNISNMIFKIPKLVSELSKKIILNKGDLLYTGTPCGVGPLKNFDKLELGISEKKIQNFRVIYS